MTFCCYTLGCKTNQSETEALSALLTAHGHKRVMWGEQADAVLINTCSVTAVSDKKSRGVIRRARRDYPEAVLAVHGCLTQGSALEGRGADVLGLVDVLGGTGDRLGFVARMEAAAGMAETVPYSPPLTPAAGFTTFELLPITSGSRTRAFFKIQDGCSNACTYCIIPSLRGPSRSMAVQDVLAGGDQLTAEGVREIVLTGIEISAYCHEGVTLGAVTAALARRLPDIRFRLGSLEPHTITDAFVQQLSGLPNLCPHFHLALQSGCDATLTAMHRHYDTGVVSNAIRRLRDAFPNCTLGCDLIVGFPGETPRDFETSLTFVEHRAFTFMHIFPYSPRPGTPAALLPGQLTRDAKQQRARQAAALANRLLEQSAVSCIGQTLKVLFETEKDGVSIGHSETYFEVHVNAPGLHNQVVKVTITHWEGNALGGTLFHPS